MQPLLPKAIQLTDFEFEKIIKKQPVQDRSDKFFAFISNLHSLGVANLATEYVYLLTTAQTQLHKFNEHGEMQDDLRNIAEHQRNDLYIRTATWQLYRSHITKILNDNITRAIRSLRTQGDEFYLAKDPNCMFSPCNDEQENIINYILTYALVLSRHEEHDEESFNQYFAGRTKSSEKNKSLKSRSRTCLLQ
jgi:hypothetical protein